MKQLNVLFYHPNDLLCSPIQPLSLGISSLYLKTYIDINRPNISDNIRWIKPEQRHLSDDDLLKLCREKSVDILCTGHYIWNNTFLLDQIKNIQSKKTFIIVAGGPSVDVNVNNNFFIENPGIDYAVYGAGEVAFADLVESILTETKLIAFNTSNLGWYDKEKQKQIVADFKYVPETKVSPYCHNKDLLEEIVNYEFKNNFDISLPYELTRGCPYSCTFCDWNGGLSTKVSRRKLTYQEEIDLFQKLGIKNIFLADANVGQYDEDVDMVAYFAKKNLEENANFKVFGNLSKLRIENNKKIYNLLLESNLVDQTTGYELIFSIQDIDKQVLENIDRPDVGWEIQKDIILDLLEKYPLINPQIQLIQGLPGQTVESWKNTLSVVSKIPCLPYPFFSELLPASPAAVDPRYQEKFKFVYSNSERFSNTGFFRGHFPASCVSFTQKDFVKMTLITMIYTTLCLIRSANKDVLVEKFLESEGCKRLEENLYTNWTLQDKFYYTVNYDGDSEIVSACQFYSYPLLKSKSFNELLKTYLPEVQH